MLRCKYQLNLESNRKPDLSSYKPKLVSLAQQIYSPPRNGAYDGSSCFHAPNYHSVVNTKGLRQDMKSLGRIHPPISSFWLSHTDTNKKFSSSPLVDGPKSPKVSCIGKVKPQELTKGRKKDNSCSGDHTIQMDNMEPHFKIRNKDACSKSAIPESLSCHSNNEMAHKSYASYIPNVRFYM